MGKDKKSFVVCDELSACQTPPPSPPLPAPSHTHTHFSPVRKVLSQTKIYSSEEERERARRIFSQLTGVLTQKQDQNSFFFVGVRNGKRRGGKKSKQRGFFSKKLLNFVPISAILLEHPEVVFFAAKSECAIIIKVRVSCPIVVQEGGGGRERYTQKFLECRILPYPFCKKERGGISSNCCQTKKKNTVLNFPHLDVQKKSKVFIREMTAGYEGKEGTFNKGLSLSFSLSLSSPSTY